jgi:hypothetical protein
MVDEGAAPVAGGVNAAFCARRSGRRALTRAAAGAKVLMAGMERECEQVDLLTPPPLVILVMRMSAVLRVSKRNHVTRRAIA